MNGWKNKTIKIEVLLMNENFEKKWLTVDDVAELLQVKHRCAKRKMREMSECVNLGSDKYQILMVSMSSFNAWMRNHRLIPQ